MRKNDFKKMSLSQLRLLALPMAVVLLSLNPALANDSKALNLSSEVSAVQQHEVKGVVKDAAGQPVVGATVIVKGTTNGAITLNDGSFSLKASDDAVLQVMFFGYETAEVTVGKQSNITIVLKEDALAVDEVVVVGYGTQKAVNLTGAVAAVDVEEMTQSRPITNIGTALLGTASGVNVSQSNYSPSNENSATITVRGEGTLNDSSPLVIVDGMESSLSSVNPQDVATMSVLKDASSAAIYGSRAANGVILITTKKGASGGVKLDYNGYVSFETANYGTVQHVTDYADYMSYVNEAYTNVNAKAPFSQKYIDLWAANRGGDPILYPNGDPYNDMLNVGISHNHTVSVSGGNDKVTFYNSFNYLDNPGVIENTGYEKFSLSSNVDARITDWLKIGTQLKGSISDVEAGADKVSGLYGQGYMATPGMVMRHPDGRYGLKNNPEDPTLTNILSSLHSYDADQGTKDVNARAYVELNPIEGLKIMGSYSIAYKNKFKNNLTPNFFQLWDFLAEEVVADLTGSQTYVSNESTETTRNFMDGTISYEKSFFNDKLDFSIMGGASQEQFLSEYQYVKRLDLVDPTLSGINGATGEISAKGYSTDWAMRSYFGRINFAWDDKYLFEANLRSDGSSRFAEEQRWGYFPSFSLGWRISEEKFMEDVDWISNLKLRGSYGSLGNNSVSNYASQSSYSAANYVLNSARVAGLAITSIANNAITWESTTMANVAIDFGMFRNRFTGSVEYYDKTTDGILINLPAVYSAGTAKIPTTNAAIVSNKGVEVVLNWNDRVGDDISYNVGVNFTTIKNKVEKFQGEDPSYKGNTYILEGSPIDAYYVLAADKILTTDADMAKIEEIQAAGIAGGYKAFPNGVPSKGDILYKDLNGDGIYGDTNHDRYEMDCNGNTPTLSYGMNLGFAYKNLDFSALLQGTMGLYGYYAASTTYETDITYGRQIVQSVMEGAWREGSTDYTYPRLTSDGRNDEGSDYWVMKRDYLKIRNIQVGYTFPSRITDKLSLSKLRVYGSLENFFTFTNWLGVDPEMTGTQLSYPQIKQALIGLNVTF